MRRHLSTILCSLALLMTGLAVGQRLPDAGSLLRDIERATGKSPVAPAPLPPTVAPNPTEIPLPTQTGATVFVSAFQIQTTRFPEAELQVVVREFTNRKVSLEELQAATRSIDDYYRQHDYLAHAYLPPQTIRNGVVQIRVVEASLGQIRVDPALSTRLEPNLAVELVANRMPLGQPLRPGQLDEALAVLNELPGVQRATSLLEPGGREGESDAVLRIEDGPYASGSLTGDNTGSKGTGIWQAALSGGLNGPLGRGDQWLLNGLQSEGSRYARLTGGLPVGSTGLRVEINAALLNYQVLRSVSPLDLNGQSWSSGLNLDYPLRRQSQLSLTASAGLDYKRMVDRMGDLDLSDKQIVVGHVGLSARSLDAVLGGGVNNLSISVDFGSLDLSGNRDHYAADQAVAKTNGQYGKFHLSLSRDQRFSELLSLSSGLQLQWAPSNLDSSEKFILGGSSGVRAYPSGEASGDSGWLANLEAKWQIQERLQLSSFYDIGGIRQHTHPWSQWQPVPGQPNNYLLQGFGVGLQWSPIASVQTQAKIAYTLGGNPGRDASGHNSDGTADKLHTWVQIAIIF